MKFLCVDTSGKALYAAVYSDGKIFYRYRENCNLQHSQTLLYAVDSVLKESGLTLQDMDYFCCNIGPGSFTGIRIGITTMRAFAQAVKKEVLSVNSLELKAYNIETKGKICVPLVDAMQNKVYCGAYLGETEILPPMVYRAEEVKEKIEGKIGNNGGLLYIYEKEIKGLDNVIMPVTPPPLAELCFKKLSEGGGTHYENMAPLYAALSQAEKNYADKHK